VARLNSRGTRLVLIELGTLTTVHIKLYLIINAKCFRSGNIEHFAFNMRYSIASQCVLSILMVVNVCLVLAALDRNKHH